MDYFLQQLVNGLSLGAIYALIAIGYTMVYGVIGMINFAHGDVFMVGAFIALIMLLLLSASGLSYLPFQLAIACAVTAALAGVYGWVIERLAYRPLRGSTRLAPLISAIGVSILLQNLVQLTQGARTKTLAPIFEATDTIKLLDWSTVTVSYLQVLIFGLTGTLLAAFTVVIGQTRFGRAQRACQQDRLMAALVGVDVDRTISLTFVIGAALAGVAGLMVLLYYGVIDFYIGFVAGIKAFTAAVLGGIGSISGAVLGGILIGLIEAFWSAYFSIAYKDVAVFAVLVMVLVVRPEGLLGRADIEKV